MCFLHVHPFFVVFVLEGQTYQGFFTFLAILAYCAALHVLTCRAVVLSSDLPYFRKKFPPLNSFHGNYSIYEVKKCHNAETIWKFPHFPLSKKNSTFVESLSFQNFSIPNKISPKGIWHWFHHKLVQCTFLVGFICIT